MKDREDKRSFADRRVEQGAEPEDESPDIGAEHEPGPSFPPIAPADGPGGEDEGYEPQTRA
ncbi:hypothetical protein [Actinocorallia libanotica]|uniref:Uncharacterized protein n=1 Tax=Actinocorallia libanotica TaxID=46162 RepID=A0ABN1R4I5_9ACTN